MCAAVLTASSCTSMIPGEDEFYFDVPRNEAVVEATEFLKSHPESVEALSQIADKIALLADAPMESADELVASITKGKPLYKTFVNTLLNTNSVASLEKEDYTFVLKEISKGIIGAVDLYIYNNANLEY